MLDIEKLSKKFGKLAVLKEVSLSIDKGKIYAVLGPNGSGKTTLIKCILDIVLPDSGTIEVNGRNVKKSPLYRDDITYLPQIANFPGNLKVIEMIRMIKDIRNRPSNEEELISLFKLESHLKKRFNTLSGGTRQKINLLLTFMFDTPIVILDEPTTGLDPVSLIHLKGLINKLKTTDKTVLITSHIMSFVEEVADEILFLLEGEIKFKGTPQQLYEESGIHNFELAIAKLLEEEYA